MHPSAEQFVADARANYDFEPTVEEFPEGTKTAADAAEAVGCDVAQIASSIVLVADSEVVVSVTSGANRVSMAKVAELVGAESARMAEADEVKRATGWSIGGVPPICHATSVPVFVDETLLEFETVWAAAGTPTAVFRVESEELVELSGGEVADVAE
ncbi:Cys-tRNA(Pro) deacylase [Halogranum gelatinilyticum]|uniref:Cys-tRNA(Pro) deacylase n=1 Tax=Halogranum gelatinilyticum TaxID=660521 RepID=A0A1G9PZE7_9EURY|nr:YbaK/EbsC family protein [Halogranum gelatinilyticum]SDM03607.1 Cys-tRNA(Pro) deacylase [Halogranum gelatinilyticum]